MECVSWEQSKGEPESPAARLAVTATVSLPRAGVSQVAVRDDGWIGAAACWDHRYSACAFVCVCAFGVAE